MATSPAPAARGFAFLEQQSVCNGFINKPLSRFVCQSVGAMVTIVKSVSRLGEFSVNQHQ
jgi:hypothetical protein